MILKRLFSLTVIFSVILASCDKGTSISNSLPPDGNEPAAEGPGCFGISLLKGLSKESRNTATLTGPTVSFDLGSIKGSTAFYFLLSNSGKCPITHVTFSADNQAFSVYPSVIDTLSPDTKISVMPIVKVVAYHGTPCEGTGSRPLMKKGANDVMVSISGVTKTCNGIDTTVIMKLKLQVHALVMDFQLYSSNAGALTLPIVSTSRSELHFPDGNYYNFSSGTTITSLDTLITLINTGNVPITYRVYKSDDLKWVGYTVTLQDSLKGSIKEGDTLQIPVRYVPGNNTLLENFFFIDGDHTVYDPKRFPVRDDGILYFTIDPVNK